MKVDHLSLSTQMAATSVSALPKLVPYPFQKVIKHFETVVHMLGGCTAGQETVRLSAVSKGITTSCSHPGGHPGKAFGSMSEAGYGLDVPECGVQPF